MLAFITEILSVQYMQLLLDYREHESAGDEHGDDTDDAILVWPHYAMRRCFLALYHLAWYISIKSTNPI